MLFFLFQKYTVNLPFKDDYRVFISFFKIFLNSNGFFEKISNLNIPDNESTPLIMRLIAIGQYYLTGYINFRYILIICWVFLVLIHVILIKVGKKNYWSLSVIGLLILNPLHQEILFRTDVATYQLATLALSLFLLYTSNHFSKLPLILKVLFFVAFMITPGGSINGMLANAMVIFIFYKNNNNKLLKATALIFFIQLIYLFVLKSDSKPLGLFDNIIKYNWKLPVAYFMSLGGLFHLRTTFEFKILAFLVGVFIFVFGIKSFVLKNPKNWDDKTMIFLFCVSSLAAIVALRYNYWISGYDSVLESRYKLYGAIGLTMVLSEVFQKSKSKILNFGVFGVIIILFIAGYYKSTFSFKDQKIKQLTDAWNIEQNVFEAQFAHRLYTDQGAPTFLKEIKAYDLKAENIKLEKALKTAENVEFESYNIENSENDAMKNADWSKLSVPLKKLVFTGNFKKYEVYLVKFELASNKSALFFLYGRPSSFAEKISGNESNTSELVHENYFDAIAGLENAKVTLLGLKNLP